MYNTRINPEEKREKGRAVVVACNLHISGPTLRGPLQ
jgi:hypothetical protein